MRLGQHCDQVRRAGEQHAVAGLDRFQPQAHGEVRLADPGWTRKLPRQGDSFKLEFLAAC
jgi:hypothetical protein